MHPNFEAELEGLRTGRRMQLLPVGSRVRVTLAGDYRGVEGRVARVGRTSYHVRVPGTGTLRVVFAGVERVR